MARIGGAKVGMERRLTMMASRMRTGDAGMYDRMPHSAEGAESIRRHGLVRERKQTHRRNQKRSQVKPWPITTGERGTRRWGKARIGRPRETQRGDCRDGGRYVNKPL